MIFWSFNVNAVPFFFVFLQLWSWQLLHLIWPELYCQTVTEQQSWKLFCFLKRIAILVAPTTRTLWRGFYRFEMTSVMFWTTLPLSENLPFLDPNKDINDAKAVNSHFIVHDYCTSVGLPNRTIIGRFYASDVSKTLIQCLLLKSSIFPELLLLENCVNSAAQIIACCNTQAPHVQLNFDVQYTDALRSSHVDKSSIVT